MQIQFDIGWLLAVLLGTTRIFAWSMIAPPLATAGLSRTVKVPFSVALSLAVLPVTRIHVPAAQVVPILSALVVQVVLGAALGFLTRLVFAAIESAGNLLDLAGGFAAAAAYDPFTGNTAGVLGRFYSMLATTLIFATNAHLVIIGGFLRTFQRIPLDGGFSMAKVVSHLGGGLSDLFVATLQIAGPMLVVLFICDMALGLLNRIAPQLNAFAMSFPIKIGLTMSLLGGTLWMMPRTVIELGSHVSQLIGAVG